MKELDLPTHLKEYIKNGRGRGNLGIPQEEYELLFYRERVCERANEILRGHFWISEDISAAEEILIPARTGTIVPIILPEDLGPFTNMDPYALSCAHDTTRSRFGQVGLVIEEKHKMMIGETAEEKNGRLYASTYVNNYSDRPVSLSGPFAYFYYSAGKILKEKELEKAMKDRMEISGVEERDWRRYYSPYTGEFTGIEFLIDPESRRYIPKSDEPIKLYTGGNHMSMREGSLNDYLKSDIPESEELILVVSEIKSNLYLSEEIHGICSAFVVRNEDVDNHIDQGFQVNSVLLRGGNTNSHIRAEHVCSTIGGVMPRSLVVRFANA